ncbi:MAG: hypothetical protein H6719_13825 [Sandaracinaceae bacterium]|nr:hypothetical protein [Sandaracinaceae bacterium]
MSFWARRSFLAPWVIVSAVLHVALFLGAAAGVGLLPGQGALDGDGFGGQSIEVEITGPNDGDAHGALQPTSDRAMPQLPAPEPEEEVTGEDPTEIDPAAELAIAAAETLPPRSRQVQTDRPPAPAVEEGNAPVPGTTETDSVDGPEATAESTPGLHPDPSGTGGDGTLAGPPAGDVAGLILGSAGLGGSQVTPRTALLPNSGVCADPVAGTWRAQKYRTSDHTWVRFIVNIRRGSGGADLTGTITSRIWTGNRSNPTPGACTAFGMDHTWRMRARGTFEGDQMSLRSSGGARLIAQDCPRGDSLYAPDSFTGRVEVMREVWESVNNDGAFDIDEPYTFRRVSCD